MSNNDRVTHAVRGYTMKFGQVQKRIAENSCFVWVVYGESFRDATIAEAAQMRKEQAKEPQGLVYFVEHIGKDGKVKLIAKPYYAELPSFHTKWSTVAQQTLARQGYALLKQANQFCQAHA
jgi:hypothetical protein